MNDSILHPRMSCLANIIKDLTNKLISILTDKAAEAVENRSRAFSEQQSCEILE